MAPVRAISALMKEWPTRVRTGVPPCSVTTSGTALAVIRSWMPGPPGGWARPRPPTCALRVGGGRGRERVGGGGAAGVLGQLALRDQRREDRRADDLAALVDDEAAVGVTVEGQPDVRTQLAHLRLQV